MYSGRVCQLLWSSSVSQSATLSPSLLAAGETRVDKLESRHFDMAMRDFLGDAAFLKRKSAIPLIEKEKSVHRSTHTIFVLVALSDSRWSSIAISRQCRICNYKINYSFFLKRFKRLCIYMDKFRQRQK